MEVDRELWPDIQAVEAMVRSGELLDIVQELAPEFERMVPAFRAAVVPMDTKSSWLAEEGMESTQAGWARTLFSEAMEAAVYWTIEILERCQGDRVQDAYALRCIPQVHGAVRDALGYIKSRVDIELNAVTDNPLLFCGPPCTGRS